MSFGSYCSSPPPIPDAPGIGTYPSIVSSGAGVPKTASGLGLQLAANIFNDIREDFHGFFEIGLEGGFINGSK